MNIINECKKLLNEDNKIVYIPMKNSNSLKVMVNNLLLGIIKTDLLSNKSSQVYKFVQTGMRPKLLKTGKTESEIKHWINQNLSKLIKNSSKFAKQMGLSV